MGADRRKQAVLAVLLTILGVILYRTWATSVGPATSSPAGRVDTRASTDAPRVAPPDVRIEILGNAPAEPFERGRNLFRFEARGLSGPVTVATPVPAGPPGGPSGVAPQPPTAPPIALKFIGIVEAPERELRLAILSDGRAVYHGREGDIIEGRYRIVRIGTESVEMIHLDGRGAQTIRLTGS